MPKMECHISDGPQTPEDVEVFGYPEEEQERIDNATCAVCGIEWVDVLAGFDTCDGCTKNV